MCGVGSLTTTTSDCMSGRRDSRSSSRSSGRSSTNNNCSEAHHFSEESSSHKMNGGGTSEKSEDGGGSTGSPPSPAGHGGSGSASPTGGCPSCRQLLCSCGKSPPSSAGLLNYQRLASTVPSLVYPPNPSNPNANPYSPEQVAYLAAAAAAAEQSALYAVAGGGLGPDMKEGGMGPSGWAYPSMYHPYDPSFAAAMSAAAAAYPFNGYSMDMNGSRRKNATRETTSTLKAWLAEHRKNPYPTKGEKIMLAIITKMTLTQVSTWFANARRRLKKENKMTWEPRNRPDDDDDDVNISDDEDERVDGRKNDKDNERLSSSTNSHHVHGKSSPTESSCSDVSKEGAVSTPLQKPRIWSVADLAGSGTGGGGERSSSGAGGDDGESNRGSSHHPHLPPHHLIPHPHLLNLHNNHHHSSSSAISSGSNGSAGGGGGGHPGSAAGAAAAAAAAAAAFLHNPHLRNSHHPHHLQQLHHPHHPGSNHHHPHHHPGSSLPGSAFSPLSRSAAAAHSEAIYRGLYPGLSHPYHSSTADNP